MTCFMPSASSSDSPTMPFCRSTLHFRALCDGLAGLELGGTIPSDAGDRLWRAGLGALVRGFAAP
jgi:hypothetical protein